jgi:predicted RNA binding protein YcfA (HicA-like mRNA interferase family)
MGATVSQWAETQTSHFRMGKGSLRTTVAVRGKKDLKKGTIAKIERDTGEKLK